MNKLTDVLRAEAMGVDLHESSDGSISIYAMRKDKTKYKLGKISSELFYCSESHLVREAIERIKFSNIDDIITK